MDLKALENVVTTNADIIAAWTVDASQHITQLEARVAALEAVKTAVKGKKSGGFKKTVGLAALVYVGYYVTSRVNWDDVVEQTEEAKKKAQDVADGIVDGDVV